MQFLTLTIALGSETVSRWAYYRHAWAQRAQSFLSRLNSLNWCCWIHWTKISVHCIGLHRML